MQGGMRNKYKILISIPKRNNSRWRSRRNLEDNIKMNLKEMGREVGYCIELYQKRDH
jgi:hypothetical protein